MKHKETSDSEGESYKRPLLLMLVINLYFWWKLFDYIDLYIWSISNATFLQLAALSINIPIYLAGLLYIFKIKVNPQILWKAWVVIAIADEARMSIFNFSGISDFLNFTVPVIPIYIIGVMYAFFSKVIWDDRSDEATENN
ncbi:hypothetical protein [uncultured Pseudoteredinibacter sp.]|uniref:hypothetical protein n=1 Tax=uncultured Pseudoteredinibacter sp. TaxID=1641701 RepID=UPI00260424B2|nr:hypothetical protein [uncultured Pseudoteredinibacter sp.]